MANVSKSELQCKICNKILKDPVNLPYCRIHLTGASAKDGLIECVPCGEKFEVKRMRLNVNRQAKYILDAEGHLNAEEKAAKIEIQKLLNEFQQLFHQREQITFEISSHDHFAEIKRKIDIHREQLKEKIDQIYLAMISQVEKHEALYRLKLEETRCFKEFNADTEAKNIEEEFRKVDLTIERVQQLQSKCEVNVKALQHSMEMLQFAEHQMKKSSFEAKKDFDTSSFGALNLGTLDRFLVSASMNKCIKVWNLETKECLRTLEGHTEKINCINVLANGHLISGCDDKLLKVWIPSSGVCLKTIILTDVIYSIKVLSGNRLACGLGGQLECGKWLEGHIDPIECIIVIPDETLVSGSQDFTIKLWNFSLKKCKTLEGHSLSVFCLLLLNNGRLVSGSADTTIKIWNVDNRKCIRTLIGHTDFVWGLESTNKHDLISCSKDKSIKIWNTTSGECMHTLTGHLDGVFCLKVNAAYYILVSSSTEIIKIWDLTSRQCTHTLDGHQEWVAGLCFI